MNKYFYSFLMRCLCIASLLLFLGADVHARAGKIPQKNPDGILIHEYVLGPANADHQKAPPFILLKNLPKEVRGTRDAWLKTALGPTEYYATDQLQVDGHSVQLRAKDPNDNELTGWDVFFDSREVYSFSTRSFGVLEPIQAFYSHGQHWILEYVDHVVVDGKLIDDGDHASKFNYRFINNHPFYFSGKENLVSVVYDGRELAEKYEYVVHYMCCENETLNPRSSDTRIDFLAKKAGKWVYVILQSTL